MNDKKSLKEFEKKMNEVMAILITPDFLNDKVNVAVKRSLHIALKIYAMRKHMTINGVVDVALNQFLREELKHGWGEALRREEALRYALSHQQDPANEVPLPSTG